MDTNKKTIAQMRIEKHYVLLAALPEYVRECLAALRLEHGDNWFTESESDGSEAQVTEVFDGQSEIATICNTDGGPEYVWIHHAWAGSLEQASEIVQALYGDRWDIGTPKARGSFGWDVPLNGRSPVFVQNAGWLSELAKEVIASRCHIG